MPVVSPSSELKQVLKCDCLLTFRHGEPLSKFSGQTNDVACGFVWVLLEHIVADAQQVAHLTFRTISTANHWLLLVNFTVRLKLEWSWHAMHSEPLASFAQAITTQATST